VRNIYVLVSLCAVVPATTCLAAPHEDGAVTYGFGVEQFTWQEFGTNGTQLLIEEGQRFVLSAQYSLQSPDADSITEFSGDLYFGGVAYDGQTQGGTPVKTDVQYLGARIQFTNESYLLRGKQQGLGLLGGVGLDVWQRDLKDSTTSTGALVSGYQETYSMLFLKLGLVWQYHSDVWQQRLKFGLRRPILVDEYIAEFDATLSPKPTTTLFASWDHSWKISRANTIAVTFYYDRTHFDPSELAPSTAGLVYQPESDTTSKGIKMMFSF